MLNDRFQSFMMSALDSTHIVIPLDMTDENFSQLIMGNKDNCVRKVLNVSLKLD